MLRYKWFLIIRLWEIKFPFYLGELFPGLRRRACSLTDMANWDTGRLEPSLTGHTCASPAPAGQNVCREQGLLAPACDLMLKLKANSVWYTPVRGRTRPSPDRRMKTQIGRPFTYIGLVCENRETQAGMEGGLLSAESWQQPFCLPFSLQNYH